MSNKAYYNEIDPFCVEWLKNLIAAGLIPDGDVDSRSIVDVQPEDIRGYTQHHWFAGIGGWPLALRLAGWGDDREVWTGSPACQPFSVAGKRKGFDDPRHLWPVLFNHIRRSKPTHFFGEQVAAATSATEATLEKTCLEVQRQEQRAKAEGRREVCQVAEGKQGPEQPSSQGMEAEKEGFSARYRCQEKGQEEGAPLQPGPVRGPDSGEDRQGGVRDNWSAVQDEWRRARLGHPFFGPSGTGEWVCDRERPSGDTRAERDDVDVGAGQGASDSQCREGKAEDTEELVGGEVQRGAGETLERDWLDGVLSDLESVSYAWWTAVLPACSVDGPHRRDRLYIYARRRALGDCLREGLEGHTGDGHDAAGWPLSHRPVAEAGVRLALEHANADGRAQRSEAAETAGHGSATHAAGWSDFQWIVCHDGKVRRIPPVQSGIQPVAYGLSSVVGRLCAYGNAIVPQVAAEVIKAAMECRP